jgi:hypothetical protein
MTGLASGLATQWVAQDETTYGVTPTWASPPATIFDSETMELKKTPKQSQGIYAGALAPRSARRVVTEYRAQGGSVGDLPAQGLNKWLFRMLGSYGQSAATLTQISTSGVYKAVHTLGALEGHTFAIQKGITGIDGTIVPYTYVGCKVSEWDISATMGEIPKWTMTIEGRNELATGGDTDPLNGSVPTLQTYTAPPGGVFTWNQGALLYGGTVSTTTGVTSISAPTAAGNIKSFSLKVTRGMDFERFSPELAGFRNEPLQNTWTLITGQFVVEFLSSAAYYAAYANDTATAFQMNFTGPIVGTPGSNHSLLGLLMSNIRLEGESAKVPGPAVLTQTIPISVFDDGTNNILQATYQTVDTV